MKVAIVGSRTASISNLEEYLPHNTTEIVSGGAKDIDTCARNYALQHTIKLTEFLPNYARYHRGAPLKRNLEIIAYADFVLIFWNGTSRGTSFVLQECIKLNIPHRMIDITDDR